MKKFVKKGFKVVCGLLTAGCIFASSSAPIFAAEMSTMPTQEEVLAQFNQNAERIENIRHDQLVSKSKNPFYQWMGFSDSDAVSSVPWLTRLASPAMFCIAAGIVWGIVSFILKKRKDSSKEDSVAISKKTTSSTAYLSGTQNPADTNGDGIVDEKDYNIPFGC